MKSRLEVLRESRGRKEVRVSRPVADVALSFSSQMSDTEAYLGKGPIPRGKEWCVRMLHDVLTVHAQDITHADLDSTESAVLAMLDVIMHASDHQVSE